MGRLSSCWRVYSLASPVYPPWFVPSGDSKEQAPVLAWKGQIRKLEKLLSSPSGRHQVRGGYTPCSAIQKLSVRYGCRLLCGRLPPTLGMQFGFTLPVAGVP